MKMLRHLKINKAFTLIELLVVVAIIAILITLLVPMIQRSMDRAKMTGCISNLKQLASATTMFASDNGGKLPHPCLGLWGVKEDGWLYSGDFKPFFDSWTNIKTGVLWDYIEDRKVYRCPADPQPQAEDLYFYPNDCRLLTSYGMNGSLTFYEHKGHRVARVSEMRPTDIIIWEQAFRQGVYGDVCDGSNEPRRGMSDRHYGKGAVGCVDGHVEVLTTNEFNELAFPAWPKYRNRLWNDPGRPQR